MVDAWDFYSCNIDGRPASIFVNLSIGKGAPIAALPYMGYIRVHMKRPRPDGLSSQDEFDTLSSLEDHLTEHFTSDGAATFVGRNTSNSCRDFFYYTSCTNTHDWEERARGAMALFAHYEFEIGHREDRNWRSYFDFLYPSKAAQQQISNRDVCRNLEEHGDPLMQEREIDHWAYFPDAASRSAFLAEALKLGYIHHSNSDPDKPGALFGVRLVRKDVPNYASIDTITGPLFELAKRFGGEYDGWETTILRKKK